MGFQKLKKTWRLLLAFLSLVIASARGVGRSKRAFTLPNQPKSISFFVTNIPRGGQSGSDDYGSYNNNDGRGYYSNDDYRNYKDLQEEDEDDRYYEEDRGYDDRRGISGSVRTLND